MATENKDLDSSVSIEPIAHSILFIRGQKVLLDVSLAELYGVETKVLKRAVRRNQERFPEDFMFQLSKQELKNLRCQIDTSSWGGHRYPPYAFTEQGVAMLSGVLRSPKAVVVNIAILRAFVRLRQMIANNSELSQKLDELDRRVSRHDTTIAEIIEAIRQLMAPPPPGSSRPIGFASWTDD